MLTFSRYIDACYFFARGCGDREKAASFPATIAYQLARSRPSFSWSIKNAIAANPSIFEESWPSQFRHLILKPAIERWSFFGPVTIVIDGLDECDSDIDQVELLNLIMEATATKKMRFLIASRPDQAIDMFFAQIHVSQHTCHIRLDEETFHTRLDIEVFLRAKFACIRQMKPEGCPRMANGEDWPGDAVIRQIADDSDSQFMFPELAVDFIDLPGFSPNEQLRILLTAPPAHAFSKLDALYEKILSHRPPSRLRHEDGSSVDYQETIMGILQIVIAWPGGPFSPARIAKLLGEKVEVVQSIIHGPMRSLFKRVSADPDSDIMLCHKSLRDYLLDRKRSRDFFISCGDADSLFSKILSYRSPTAPLQSYFPGAVLDVLTALLVKGGHLSVLDIAASLYIDYHFVERVVYGPARALFDVTAEGVWLASPNLQSFLRDAGRAGDSFIPKTDSDALLLRIVTRQSLPSTPYSQDVWMDILAVVCIEPFPDLDISGTAFILGVAPKVVEAAVLGPSKSLFTVGDGGRVGFSTPELPSFLLDPKRATQFCIPPNKRDAFYTSIIFRPPSIDPLQVDSQNDLDVLAVVDAWNWPLTVSEIAAILDVDPSTVEAAVSGRAHALFKATSGDKISFSTPAFTDFLSDRRRAGEFFLLSARIFTQILSRPPPSDPSRTYSRDVLMGVLSVVKNWGRNLPVPKIAAVLNVDPSTVNNVLSSNILFARDGYSEIFFQSSAFKDFLSEPEFGGEYFLPSNTLDSIFTRHLSCQPSSDLSQTCPPDILKGVLAVVRDWGRGLPVLEIAAVLDVDPSTVNNAIRSRDVLFRRQFNGNGNEFSGPALADFLSDPERAGEYFVSNIILDNIFIRNLSRQPSSDLSQTCTRNVLLDVLAVVMYWERALSVARTAIVLDIDPSVVENVIRTWNLLFDYDLNGISVIHFSSPAFKKFLSSPERAGEYFVSDVVLDNIFTRILSRRPKFHDDQLHPWCRQILLDVLAVLASRRYKSVLDITTIASILNLSAPDMENVIAEHASDLYLSDYRKEFFIDEKLKRFLWDIGRAGEFYIPDEATAIKTGDSHYTSLYERTREIVERTERMALLQKPVRNMPLDIPWVEMHP